MKRIALVFVLAVCTWYRLFSQSSGPADVILLLDTSCATTGTPLYEETNAYITGGFLRKFLRIGDTFHLIPFSDKPFLDISRRVTSRSDAEIVIGRMFLHYPLNPRADIPAALVFAEKFVSGLPDRPKRIVLVSANAVSDGATGPFAEARTRLARQNTTLDFVQIVPGQYVTAPPRPAPVPPPVVTQPMVTQPVIPPEIEEIPEPFAAREQMQDRAEGVLEPGPEQAAEDEQVQNPPSVAETQPEQKKPVEQKPAEKKPEKTPKPVRKPVIPVISLKQLLSGTTIVFIVSGVLWLLALLIPALFATAFSKKIFRRSPAETLNLLLLTMYVEDQSIYIGRRNIHALKPGCGYTVGGKDSDFLIFVVHVPPHIAKIQRDKKGFTFTPLAPRFFPDLGSGKLKDCVGKPIRIISDKNYQLEIRFNTVTVPKPEL